MASILDSDLEAIAEFGYSITDIIKEVRPKKKNIGQATKALLPHPSSLGATWKKFVFSLVAQPLLFCCFPKVVI